MKKTFILILALMLVGISVSAGVKYSGTVKVELPAEQQAQMKNISPEEKAMMKKMGVDPDSMKGFSFDAMADNGKFKMVYTSSFTMFPKGSYLLGNSASKVTYLVFPDKRQYVKSDRDKLQDAVSEAQQKVKMSYSGLQVNVTPLAPKIINGLPCTGKRITVAYSLTTSMMGFKHTSHSKTVTDYYSTSKYDAMSLFGGINYHTYVFSTGYGPFDKVIRDKVGFLGFPVLAKTTRYNDGKDGGTTIMKVHDVHMETFAASTFQLPPGYTGTTLENMINSSMGKGPYNQNNGSQEAPKKKKRSLKDILSGFND